MSYRSAMDIDKIRRTIEHIKERNIRIVVLDNGDILMRPDHPKRDILGEPILSHLGYGWFQKATIGVLD